MIHYFAVTLKNQYRTSFDNDVLNLRDGLAIMRKHGFSLSYLGWELQPKGLHNMHIHCLAQKNENRFVNYKQLHNELKKLNINTRLDHLALKKDIKNWAFYCTKGSCDDLAYNYAESTGSEYNSVNIFRRRMMNGLVASHSPDPRTYEPTDDEMKAFKEWQKEVDEHNDISLSLEIP